MDEQALGKSWKPFKVMFDNGQSVTVGAIRKPEWQLSSHKECPDCKRLEKQHAPELAAWKAQYLKRHK